MAGAASLRALLASDQFCCLSSCGVKRKLSCRSVTVHPTGCLVFRSSACVHLAPATITGDAVIMRLVQRGKGATCKTRSVGRGPALMCAGTTSPFVPSIGFCADRLDAAAVGYFVGDVDRN